MNAHYEASKKTAVRRATFNSERTARFILEVVWDQSKPLLGWGMANPSYAGEESNDMTFNRVWWFTARSGRYGGFVIMNAVAHIDADSAKCREWCKRIGVINTPGAREILRENLNHMLAMSTKVDAWVLAYGEVALTFGQHVNYMLDCLRGAGKPFMVLGTSSGGTPKHPMARGVHRIPDDAPFLEYDPRIRRLGGVAYPD